MKQEIQGGVAPGELPLKPPKSQKDETKEIRETQKQLMKESTTEFAFIKAQQDNIR